MPFLRIAFIQCRPKHVRLMPHPSIDSNWLCMYVYQIQIIWSGLNTFRPDQKQLFTTNSVNVYRDLRGIYFPYLLDLSKIVLDLQKSRAWVPYLQNPVYGPITLLLSSEIKQCTHGNLHFEHDELLAFYRRFFPLFFQSSKLWTFFANFSKCKNLSLKDSFC